MGPNMGLGMQLRPEMQLRLAPRMIQSMEILQLPSLALQERIQDELLTNPLLEMREPRAELSAADGNFNGTESTEIAPSADPTEPGHTLEIDPVNHSDADFDRLSDMVDSNRDWSDNFHEEHRPSSNRIEEEGDKKHVAEANILARPPSLKDHLDEQLSYFTELPEEQLRLARYLLTHLDENGYLVAPLTEIALGYERPLPLTELEEALSLIQRLDPPGVGARDLRECLLLQIGLDTPHREVLRALVQNHLEDIQHNRMPNIQKRTGYTVPVIQVAIEQLKRLNPRPGAIFKVENVQYIQPDIVVERNDQDEYVVRLLDDWMPRVYLSKKYLEMYRDKNADPKTREFVKRKLQAAQWLLDAIEQRRNTVTKVTKAIIARQKAFLDHGPEMIEPLKMQQIADEVGVHVTTVSRAVDDKWVQTPRGVFPLKRFFGGGTHTASGEEVAYEAIKQKLLEIIGNEDKAEPLSDEDLMNKLNDAGYPLARRTVTKYRKMLKIPSSRQRKVWT